MKIKENRCNEWTEPKKAFVVRFQVNGGISDMSDPDLSFSEHALKKRRVYSASNSDGYIDCRFMATSNIVERLFQRPFWLSETGGSAFFSQTFSSNSSYTSAETTVVSLMSAMSLYDFVN